VRLAIESRISPVRDRASSVTLTTEPREIEVLERRDAVARATVPQWALIAAVGEPTPPPWSALHEARRDGQLVTAFCSFRSS
jgi:hypothetical protein